MTKDLLLIFWVLLVSLKLLLPLCLAPRGLHVFNQLPVHHRQPWLCEPSSVLGDDSEKRTPLPPINWYIHLHLNVSQKNFQSCYQISYESLCLPSDIIFTDMFVNIWNMQITGYQNTIISSFQILFLVQYL